MGQELTADSASLTRGAGRMRESAELFGGHTDSLLRAVSGGARSPWGTGVIATAMDQINQMLGQACRHLQTNLAATSDGIQTMADRQDAAEGTVVDAALSVA
jgi:hypothetical protein